ncbi:MAG: YfiR family protein [Syntrophales bacterium]
MQKRIICFAIFVMILNPLAFLFSPGKSCADEHSYRDYEIKAALLYNFAKFTEWPARAFASQENTITVCVLGEDPIETPLSALSKLQVKGKNITIRHINKHTDMRNCHILYISQSEKRNLPDILSKLKGLYVLSISDIEGFAENGGIINLVRLGNKIRFEINITAAKNSGINISSNLLDLATKIY